MLAFVPNTSLKAPGTGNEREKNNNLWLCISYKAYFSHIPVYSIIIFSLRHFECLVVVKSRNLLFNPIQTRLYFGCPRIGVGGGGGVGGVKDIDMKLTPLIKRREINLLLLSYLSCDVT